MAWRVRECGYAERETGFFAHAPIQTRTAPVAQDGREKIERGNVRICDLRNVPRQREMRQFRGKFLVHFPPAKLRRFRRNEQGLERFLGIRLEQFGELLPYFFCVDISDYDEGEIVRDVTRFIVLYH